MVMPIDRNQDPGGVGGVGGLGGLGGPGFGGNLSATLMTVLQRFKMPLYGLIVGYSIVVLMALAASEPGQSLSWFFMLVMAHSIATNNQGTQGAQCVVQCVVPFAMFATMTLFLDVFALISRLNMTYPTAGDFFKSTCPMTDQYIIQANTTVYNTTDYAPILISEDKTVNYDMDYCASQAGRVIFHSAMVIVIFLDIAAASIGWKMLQALLSQVPLDDIEGNLGGVGGARNPFIPGGAAGGFPGQQEMVGMPGRQQQQNRRGRGPQGPSGFQAFQGDGARLSI